MDKKIRDYLERWQDNSIIDQDTYDKIVTFEENTGVNQKSNVARAITLIGGLFLLSGLLGTIPLLWMNLPYWAQLGLLIATTYFLFYAASYSEKLEDGKLFVFNSTEKVSSFLFLISNISFGGIVTFSLNILQEVGVINISEDLSYVVLSFLVLIFATYLFNRTKYIFQHAGLFYCICFFLGSIGNIIFPNIEPWGGGLFAIAIGSVWGVNTYSTLLKPSWIGYFLSTTTISIGTIIIIDDLIGNEIISILILLIGSIFYVWASIQLSEQVIFFIGGLGLLINLPRLIRELLPDNIWPPLIVFIIGSVLIGLGLYLNTIKDKVIVDPNKKSNILSNITFSTKGTLGIMPQSIYELVWLTIIAIGWIANSIGDEVVNSIFRLLIFYLMWFYAPMFVIRELRLRKRRKD